MDDQQLNRRAILRGGALLLTTSATLKPRQIFGETLLADDQQPLLRVALITDLHHADKPPSGTRYYRETLAKFSEAAIKFAALRPNFIVEIGDLIDAADSPELELEYLSQINSQFEKVSDDRHYVLGNHCVDMLTKAEFLGKVGQPDAYYSFDRRGVHFVVLDACFRSDGKSYGRKNSSWDDANIPSAEVEWLRADLMKAEGKIIVFAHQRLDGSTAHCVKNAAEIRGVFAESKKVAAVFQGHSHQNDYKEVDGVHYCTLAAMIEGSGTENNSYSLLDIHADGTMKLTGFRKQKNYAWS